MGGFPWVYATNTHFHNMGKFPWVYAAKPRCRANHDVLYRAQEKRVAYFGCLGVLGLPQREGKRPSLQSFRRRMGGNPQTCSTYTNSTGSGDTKGFSKLARTSRLPVTDVLGILEYSTHSYPSTPARALRFREMIFSTKLHA